jgi:hypothetical protein
MVLVAAYATADPVSVYSQQAAARELAKRLSPADPSSQGVYYNRRAAARELAKRLSPAFACLTSYFTGSGCDKKKRELAAEEMIKRFTANGPYCHECYDKKREQAAALKREADAELAKRYDAHDHALNPFAYCRECYEKREAAERLEREANAELMKRFTANGPYCHECYDKKREAAEMMKREADAELEKRSFTANGPYCHECYDKKREAAELLEREAAAELIKRFTPNGPYCHECYDKREEASA